MVLMKVFRCKANAKLPSYAKEGDAGMDLCSCEYYLIHPGDRQLVSTGIKIEFPTGYELQIRPRSGLALKYGISVVNTPGTVDAGYRGEIGVIIINHGHEDFIVNVGDKIAQAVLKKVELAEIQEVFSLEELSSTERGEGGFGSSGKR